MYIGIYTTTEYTSNEINVAWYITPNNYIGLFNDYHNILDSSSLESFSGKIIEVEDTDTITEQLILCGLPLTPNSVTITLQNGEQINMNYCVIPKHYKPLYDIAFEGFSINSSFTKSSLLNKSVSNTDDIIRTHDLRGEPIYLKGVKLQELSFKILKSNVSNSTLIKWFSEADKICYKDKNTILERVYNNINRSEKQETNAVESCMEEPKVQKKEDIDWMNEFCRLYAEPDPKYDTLITDAYKQYVTASSWTETPTVNTQTFIKHIKETTSFVVKRKAKGMVIVGHRFLVDEQEEMYNKIKESKLIDNNLFKYFETNEISNLLNSDPKGSIGDFESKLLLSKAKPITKMMIKQFYSNPYIKKSLPEFSKYIKEIQERNTFDSKFELFKETFNKLEIFCPFSSQIFKYTPTFEPFDSYNYKIDSVYGNINDYNGETDITNILAGFDK